MLITVCGYRRKMIICLQSKLGFEKVGFVFNFRARWLLRRDDMRRPSLTEGEPV